MPPHPLSTKNRGEAVEMHTRVFYTSRGKETIDLFLLKYTLTLLETHVDEKGIVIMLHNMRT